MDGRGLWEGKGDSLGQGNGAHMTLDICRREMGEKKMLRGHGTSGKEGPVTLSCCLALENHQIQSPQRGDLWPRGPRDMLFLTYICMWRSNIYMGF